MPTDETWDGTGVDPWMPKQLADELDADIAESKVRRALSAGLSSWLKAVSSVVVGAIPDTYGVFTKETVWRGVVKDVVYGPIKESMLNMYVDLLGAGDWSKRAAVTQQLTTTEEQLLRFPDTVFSMLNAEKTRIIQAGGTLADVAAGLESFLVPSAKQWDVKTNLITRTETMSALNAGRTDAFRVAKEHSGDPLYQMWLSMLDAFVRPSHVAAHGQVVPVGQTFTVGTSQMRYPGDLRGSRAECINCRCRTVLVDQNGTSVTLG